MFLSTLTEAVERNWLPRLQCLIVLAGVRSAMAFEGSSAQGRQPDR